jgi:carbon monoxide dehydrogenase subunit G
MAKYTATVETDQPADQVFAYLVAFEHTAEWDPTCRSARRVTDGEPAVGTRFELEFSALKTTFHYEITELEAPHSVTLTGHTGLLHSVDRITVDELPSGARVTYDADVNLKLRGGAVLDPLLTAAFRRAGDKARDGLSQRLSEPIAAHTLRRDAVAD